MNKPQASALDFPPLPYPAIQDGLLDFLRVEHNYQTRVADYPLNMGLGAAGNGAALVVCREFCAFYPAYALFAIAHHGGHGQHIRTRDHLRIIELLDLPYVNLTTTEKQALIREIYAQDHDVSCIGLGLLVDAFDAGYLPFSSRAELHLLLEEMHDYYLHDASEFLRCLATGALPRLTDAPAQTTRHPWVRDLTIKNRQPVLPARKLTTALVFHVGTPTNAALSAQADRAMRRRAQEIMQETIL